MLLLMETPSRRTALLYGSASGLPFLQSSEEISGRSSRPSCLRSAFAAVSFELVTTHTGPRSWHFLTNSTAPGIAFVDAMYRTKRSSFSAEEIAMLKRLDTCLSDLPEMCVRKNSSSTNAPFGPMSSFQAVTYAAVVSTSVPSKSNKNAGPTLVFRYFSKQSGVPTLEYSFSSTTTETTCSCIAMYSRNTHDTYASPFSNLPFFTTSFAIARNSASLANQYAPVLAYGPMRRFAAMRVTRPPSPGDSTYEYLASPLRSSADSSKQSTAARTSGRDSSALNLRTTSQ